MEKFLIFLFLFVLSICPPILSQVLPQDQLNSTSNLMDDQSTVVNSESIDNQQINQDEGYGADDEEYYGAEGTNSQNALSNNI